MFIGVFNVFVDCNFFGDNEYNNNKKKKNNKFCFWLV